MNMDIEFKKPEEIKAFQEGLLHDALVYLKENSKYYQRMFEKYHIDIEKIRTIEDLQKIPFTEKKDLQLFNDEFLCCPKEKVVDWSAIVGVVAGAVVANLVHWGFASINGMVVASICWGIGQLIQKKK